MVEVGVAGQSGKRLMRSLKLDFAAPGWRRLAHQMSLAHWIFLALGLSLCAVLAAEGYRLLNQRIQLTFALQDQLRARVLLRPTPTASPQRAFSSAQTASINAAVFQLNQPWRDLFSAMEDATPDTIALLAIESDAKRSFLKVSAEAKTSDDMVDYIKHLKKQMLFSGVVLTRHEINEKSSTYLLRFQFEAQWKAQAP